MNKISKVFIKPLEKSVYLKPYAMDYIQNGSKRTWDFLTVHDSVAVIIFNTSRNVLVFVKQFRPAVYYGSIPPSDRKQNCEIDTRKYPPNNGITIELCAGIVDKKLSLGEIAKEEVLEECGYDVPLCKLKKICSHSSGVDLYGSLQTDFYCEVTDSMRICSSEGAEKEIIDVIEMTVDDAEKYVKQINCPSPPGLMFAIYWFLHNKVNK